MFKKNKDNKKKKFSLRSCIVIMIILAFLLSALSFAYPYTRKSSTVKNIGMLTMSQTEALAMAIGHYSSDSIERTANNMSISKDYKTMSALLSRVKTEYNFQKVYVIKKLPSNKYVYVADSDYRDNGALGVDYMSSQNEYPFTIYRSSKTIIDDILSGKIKNGYINDVITIKTKPAVITSYVPITAPDQTVVAVLGVDTTSDVVSFSKLGFVDFTFIGFFSLIAMVAGIALLYFWSHIGKIKPNLLAPDSPEDNNIS